MERGVFASNPNTHTALAAHMASSAPIRLRRPAARTSLRRHPVHVFLCHGKTVNAAISRVRATADAGRTSCAPRTDGGPYFDGPIGPARAEHSPSRRPSFGQFIIHARGNRWASPWALHKPGAFEPRTVSIHPPIRCDIAGNGARNFAEGALAPSLNSARRARVHLSPIT